MKATLAPRPDTVFHRVERDEFGLPKPVPPEPSSALSPRPDTVFHRVERDELGLPRPARAIEDQSARTAASKPARDHRNAQRPNVGGLESGPRSSSHTVQIEGQALKEPIGRPVVDTAKVGPDDESVPYESPPQIRLTRTLPREPNLLPPRSPDLLGATETLLDPELREVTEAFAGRFDILRQIGRGGMGSVFLALQTGTQRQLAVKVLRGLRNKKDFIRFEREMNLMASISHPNVVKVFDYGQTASGSTFLAMEYVQGQTLFELIYRHRLLPLQQTLRIAHHTALGLGAAHDRGIIHRDVKPENIMVSNHFGLPDFAQILDFGIAREAKSFLPGAAPLTSGGVFLGTPRYASPEAIRGEVLTARADVYSLGCLLFQLLAERCPFEDASPLVVMDQHLKNRPTPMLLASRVAIPAELATLVDAMLSKRAQYRPESMSIVANRLASLMETPSGTLPPSSPPSPPSPRPEPMRGFAEDLGARGVRQGEGAPVARANNPAKHQDDSFGAKRQEPSSAKRRALVPALIWGLAALAFVGWALFLQSN